MALVIRAVQVLAIPAGREEGLSPNSETFLGREGIRLTRGRILETRMGDCAVLHV